ncbi:unnamed protein product [Caenorhabditis bovis]|uniref:Transient receptor ion channel domain-containing protein n=1 Tax=Caenorhabditis bovis TaxID=2654633 RepID=A0A8S1EQ95_9PELO|nr:unnamed protein product [Caenorhabditis bovis]
MDEKEIAQLKENVGAFKLPEIGEREEGYEGHYEWNPNDPNFKELVTAFYKAAKNGDDQIVEIIVSGLVPGGEDGRLSALLRLIKSTENLEDLKEALLIAVSLGSRPLVEIVLVLFNSFPYMERSGCSNSPNFPPHMTPLMLACIMNNFAITQCLLLRGHTIQIPHFPQCECNICTRMTVGSRNNTRLVDVMRAVSSEAFLWLATDDVFAASCSIAKDLQKLIDDDDLEFVATYRALEANVQRFLAKLADMAWRTDEFNTIISNPSHCARRNVELSAPRLQMALDSHMRYFTCSANAQTAFKSIWRADWFNFGNKPLRDMSRLARHTILLVPLAILHSLIPNKAASYSIPMSRYISHCTSYLTFLLIATLHPLFTDFGVHIMAFWCEVYLYIYVLGLYVERLILYYRVGSSIFFSFWWRWFDVILISSFAFAFLFFVGVNTEHTSCSINGVSRNHWPSTDFALLHEICLSVACIIAISKIFYYMQLLKGIGGSVISVGKCIGKVYTYLIIMIIVIFSFSVGLNLLVGPYVNRVSVDSNGAVEARTNDEYSTLGTSTKNLFWSIFGYLGPSTYTTVAGNAGPEQEPVNHPFNTAAVEMLGALYHGIIIITLMNLMTSLLVKKADEVLDNEELEFKYTRAAIYSEFLSWEMAAPPPLNLILIPAHLIYRKLRGQLACASPGWGSKPSADEHEEKILQDKCNRVWATIFHRFCAAKEVKFKSIWRSEFDKEEKQPSRVAYLTKLSPVQQIALKYVEPEKTYEKCRTRKAALIEKLSKRAN